VIAALEVVKDKLFTSWTCTVHKGYYLVSAFFADTDWELGARELDVLCEVNPLRVVSVSVHYQNKTPSLRIRVSDRNEPIVLTETQLVHVRKRSRWFH